MNRTADPKPASQLIVLATFCAVLAALYLAQEVLIPIALAILFSFLLAPVVRLLERAKLPRVAAVVLSVVLAFAAVGGVGYVVYNQLADLTGRLEGYSDNVKKKVAGLEAPVGWFRQKSVEVRKVLNVPASQPTSKPSTAPAVEAAAVVTGTPPAAQSTALQSPATQPVQRVEVVNQQSPSEVSPLDVARSVLTRVLGPAGTAFIVIVFTVFMLLQREDLRDRVIRLAGRDRLTMTTEALDDAAGRVSRYLMFQSIVNGTVGVVLMAALWVIGKLAGNPFPSPALWGLLSALMRFIPYVGIWISALLPILMALAVFTSLKWTLATVGAYLVVELVTANAAEPLLFGSSTGIGSLAVLVAAAFWTWLWGPVGLLLSTPLTVCLVVMGKYVPALEFLNVLLSDEPALSPPDRVYQRLLADDQEEAADLVHEYARAMPLEELYDTVLLPALAQAEADAHQHGLTPDRRAGIFRGVADVVDELGDRLKTDAVRASAQAAVDAAKGSTSPPEASHHGSLAAPPPGTRVHLPQGCVLNVVCLPAHDETDELAATMVAQLLEARGYCVTVVSQTQLASEMVGAVEAAKPDAVIVSALPPAAVTHARYLSKRLQGRLPEVKLIVGLWTSQRDLQRTRERIAGTRDVQLAAGIRQAIGLLHEIVAPKMVNTAMAARAETADRPAHG